MPIQQLNQWAKSLANVQVEDGELLSMTPDCLIPLMGGQGNIKRLLDDPEIASGLNNCIQQMVQKGVTQEHAIDRCKYFLADVCRIDHPGSKSLALAVDRSEIARKLTALSNKAKGLAENINALSMHIKNARYVPYLTKRHEAGNQDNFKERRWGFSSRTGETAIDEFLEVFASAIDEQVMQLRFEMKRNRVVAGENASDRAATRFVQMAANHFLGLAQPSFVHTVVSVLRGESADISSTRRRMKRN